MRNYVLFINVTKKCNIDCVKCYLTSESRSDSLFLSNRTLELLLSSQEIQDCDDVVVIFQGGEVSVVGEQRMISYCDLVSRVAPKASMTMVSNLVSMPDWLIDLSHNYFNSKIETTFAFGGKKLFGGHDNAESRYVEKFTKSLKKVIGSGIFCTVNVESNPETLAMGPDSIIDLAIETGCYSWDFDFSIDFESYLRSQSINIYGCPQLDLRVSYAEYSNYFEALIDAISYRGLVGKFQSGFIEYLTGVNSNTSFNVGKELNFITLNPDGTLTTNPLFSDLPKTYIGNINTSKFCDILNSSLRRSRARYERSRMSGCLSCPFFDGCGSGSSHVPLYDGSGDCVGLFNLRSKFGSGEIDGINHPLIDRQYFRSI